MRLFDNPVILAFAASLFVCIGLTPAAATNARDAIRLCDKNPNCSYTVRDNGSVDLCIKGPGGACDQSISCPQTGECSCDICIKAGGSGKGGKLGKINVQGVLTATPIGPRPKTTVQQDGGLLQGGSGFGVQGPAAAGMPARGAAPAAPQGGLK